MDLCFGDEGEKRYLGILVRSIYDIKEERMITGPSLTVDEILKNFNLTKVKDLMNVK